MDFLENKEKTLAAAEEHPSESSSSIPCILGVTVDFFLPRFNINPKQLLPQHFRSISIIPGIIQKHNTVCIAINM